MSATILIVDDSLTVRMDLADAFAAAGLEPLPCSSAEEARKALAARTVALVVLDVLLPDADGVDLLREIRSAPATTTLPVLLLSTEAEVANRIRGLKTGADDYIGKPYDPGYVVARAHELLRLRRQDDPKTTILLIDDSTTFRERLREELQDVGYAVLTAATGEEGLRLAAASRPAAIVVDGEMPGIDGATVIRRLRLDAALRSMPCVLLTASESHVAELTALDAGADAFVRKDEDITVILARLSAVLRAVHAEPEAVASLAGPKRILAVDDSMTYLQEIASLLRSEGYDVVMARSGEEAIAMLVAQSVDCILLDLLMPGIGGKESCRRIKSNPNFRDIPLIMLTAIEDRRTLIEGLATGADDYISKSSDFDVLKARIQAQIRRKQFEDENRRIRERLLRSEMEASEARAARQLAESKAALVEELERRNEEVRRLNEELEHRVAERTGELSEAYEELRRTQQSMMEQERLRAFGQMASGVAHDINNALSPAALYLQSLLERNERLSAPTRDTLVIVQRAIDTVTDTVARLREFYRKRETQLALEPVQLNSIVEQVIELTRVRWSDMPQERGAVIDLRQELDPNLPSLMGVGSEIRDALTNLILNAVDAMPAGGMLTVRTRVITHELKHSGQLSVALIALEVADTGSGMDEVTRLRCLEPFFTTKGERGTGLGLAMVYGMIQRHSAELEIESVSGRGTVMRCLFPAAISTPRSVQKPVSFSAVTGLRILLVDDDPLILEALRLILETDGHYVETAGGGEAAIRIHDAARARGEPFAVTISDLGMPHMDGRTLARRLKVRPSPMKIILLTGWGQRMQDNGESPPHVDCVLPKPPKLQELREALAAVTADATAR